MDTKSAGRSVFRRLLFTRSFRIGEPQPLPGASLSARICRSLSRGLGRMRIARSCGIATLFWAAGVAGSASAADFVVTSSADSGAGTLRQAMIDAAASGDPTNTITFDNALAGQQIQLLTGLPIIRENLTINGSGAAGLTIDGGGAVRPFFVESGTVLINDLVIQNGQAKGGDGGGPKDGGSGGGGLGAGGAIFVRGGNVTVENVTFQNNTAQGGSPGTDTGGFSATKSFGGGGLGGNGGADPGVSGNNATGGGGAFDDAPPASSISGAGSAGGGTNGGAGGITGNSTGGAGGDYGGGGGASAGGGGGAGGYGGGGGGAFGGTGGAGGFGGGGGSATFGDGGNGGFGGGGGGSRNNTAGLGGFGGGDGAGAMGGGGAGFGGAVFVADGATLTVRNSGLSGGTVQGGTGAVNGSAAGTGVFLQNSGVTFDVTTGNSITVSDTIADAAGNAQPGGVTVTGAGKLTLTGTNTYSGGTTVTGGGTLSVSDDVNLGDASGALTLDDGTLQWTGPSNNIGRTVNLGTGGGTLEITSSGPTWSGTIQGSGALTVAGAGSLFLSGTNTYSGGTVKNSTGDLYVFTDANLGDVAGDFTLNAGRLSFRGGDETFARDFIMGTGGTVATTQNNITFSGVVSGAGALNYINFNSAGSLTLDGANTYTGGTNLNATNGTLRLGTNGSLASTGALTINVGTFDLNGNTQTVGTFGGTGGILDLNGGDFTTNSAANSNYQGVIQGNGTFTKAGVGALTLSGTNTYIGLTSVNGGTLVVSNDANLGNAANGLAFGGGALRILGTTTIDRTTTLNPLGGTIDIQSGDQGTYSGDISGSGGLTKSGAGLLILSGTNSYLGGTTVSGGTLQGNTTSLQGNIVNNASVVFDQALGGTYAGNMSGTGALTKQGAGTLVLSGTNSYSGGTTISAGTLQGNTASLQGNITDNAALVFNQVADGTFAGDISGTGSFTKQGAGRLILDGTNSYSGGTTISAGTLEGNTASLQGDITNNAALVFNQQTTGTYADVISGTGSVTKTGAGELTFSGTNTYIGQTSLNGGTLVVSNDANLGNAANGLTFGGGALRILGTTTIDRTTTLNALGGTIDIQTGDQGTYSGDISGNGGLTKAGAGLLILSGNAAYAGGTTVSGGTLQGSTDNLHGTIVNNAAVVFDQAVIGMYGGDMSGTGSLTKQGIGTLILSGTNTYTGGTTITSGTLQGNTASLQGDITNNAALVFNQTTDGTFAGDISGTGSFTKQGTGRLILDGTNSYTGGTTISAGTLEGNTASLQGDITNNAALVFNQQTTGTYADVISGTGSFTKEGAGRLVLSGANTYTGTTTVDAGNLAVNGSITSAVTVNGGAILSGNGTITGDVANSGSVGPGNSIDTLHVVGNYTQAANGSLDIEIAPGSGNTDVLAVTGTATIDGALNIYGGGNPAFSVNHNYTFLTATGGVTGVFSSVTDDLAFLDAHVNYNDPNAVSIVLLLNGTNFASVAQTPNQLAVAGALDTASSTATGAFGVLIQNILGLTTSQALSSFNQLSGEIIASSSSASIEQGQQTLRILADHVRNTGNAGDTSVTARMYSPDRAMAFVNGGSLPQNDDAIQLANYSSGRTSLLARGRTAEETLVQYLTGPTGVARTWDGWIDGFGQQGNFDSNGNASSVKYGVGGTTFGAGYHLDNQTVVGLLGGYANSIVRGGGSGADQANVDTTQVGVYARTGFGNHYLLGVAAYGYQDYATSRAVNVGGVPTPTTADYNANQAGLLFEYGQNRNFGSIVVQPLASIQYINQQTDSFTEQGAGGAALNVAGRTDDSLRASLGARLMMPITVAGNHILVPEIHGRYMHELLGGSQNIGATFTGAPGTPFTIQGVSAGESFFLYGLGATYGLTDHISLYGHYLGQATSQLVSNTGTGGLQITW